MTAPSGFRAAGVHCGIKASKPDLALIVSDKPATIAGVFTTNRVQAAPVKLCREKLGRKLAQAIIVNSGSANACTGAAGRADAEETARAVAQQLGIDADLVFPCSTGTIGTRLPMKKVMSGLVEAVEALSGEGGPAAARAILTTDTKPKAAAVQITLDGRTVRLGGMAKGAGMIHPNMATMLAFLTTDAAVDPDSLQAVLNQAVANSFNRISIDGDQSTNDTVLFMANGMAGNTALTSEHDDWHLFARAVEEVTRYLACEIVRDGEGATRFVTVLVKGAESEADADRAARAIANSLLVKTSWYGGDPNWGRVIDALGYSGAALDEHCVEIAYDDMRAVLHGMADPDVTAEALAAVLRRPAFTVTVDLHIGDASATVYTCDCSEEYVKINSDYMT